MSNYNEIAALNYSGAKLLLRSPAHYKTSLTTEREDTPALRIGRLSHMAAFEPSVFIDTVAEEPDLDRRTKEGKTQYEEFKKNLPDYCITVKKNEFETISRIGQSATEAMKSIGFKIEQAEAVYVKDYGNYKLKGRVDAIGEINGEKAIIDLKTCESAEPAIFSKSVANYMYHLQNAWYSEITGITLFYFIAQEKEPPYAWRVYTLDEGSIEQGKKLMREAISIYQLCSASNQWPSYSKEITTLSLPNWAYTK